MKYTELEITVKKAGLDGLCVELSVNGFESYEIYDYADLEDAVDQVFFDYIDDDLLEQKDQDPKIKIYFDDASKAELDRLKAVLESVKEKHCIISVEESQVDTEDWENNWKKYFYPFPVGKRLYIKPTWLKADDDAKGRMIMNIDPASAFGSGTHVTTRLCLEQLEDFLRSGDNVLDMGCGSGILGIGALMLGAGSVYAVDIDENAVRVAEENFAVNNCKEGSYRVVCGDAVSDSAFAESIPGGYNAVLANIVAGVITSLGGFFFEKLAPNGVLIASGIISEREQEVREALEKSGFAVLRSISCEDWAAIVCRKPEA